MMHGKVLRLREDGAMPEMAGVKGTADEVYLPEKSYGFLIYTDARAKACM